MKRLLTVLALLLCVGAQAAIFQNPFTTNSPTLTSSRLLFMSATGVPATSGSSLMVYNSISNPLDKTGTGLMMFQTAPIIDAPAISTSIALTFLKTNLLSVDAGGLVTTTKFGAGISWDPATQTISSSVSGDTTGTNIVTLTQTGTNVPQLDFSLVARGGAWKLQLTNNAYIGAPANVASSPFSQAWLVVQQPSTGTCFLTFTNGFWQFPEGVAPIIDTNNGAVTIYQFISDPISNGLVHGTMSLKSKLIP